ncbi:MAG: hypothetical protein EOM20_04175 [Spartobacteria bacterium]|nr:hypothetical protein [Spartobacteria bacterium]
MKKCGAWLFLFTLLSGLDIHVFFNISEPETLSAGPSFVPAAHAITTKSSTASTAPPSYKTAKAPPEEELRKWWVFKPGSQIVLLKPDYTINWTPEMNAYAGREAIVTQLVGKDNDGYYTAKVDVDEGYYSWRIRNIADRHSKEAGVLDSVYVAGTEVPLCIVPKSATINLYADPASGKIIGSVPSITSNDIDGKRMFLPRYLYVHAYSNNYLEVMESDLSSRESLGWVKRDDVYQWVTRQGYIINYARTGRTPVNLARGYAEKEDIGRPGKEVYIENIKRFRNTSPNQLGMPDGLLIGKNAEPYKGMDVVSCAFKKMGEKDFTLMYMPVHSTLNPATDTIIPVALLSETDLCEIEAMAHVLYAACDEGDGRIDEIRDALTKNWDITSKVVIGAERRNQQYAKKYQKLQTLFPALTYGLKLPPDASPEKSFKDLGHRAENIANNAARILQDMRRDKRDWVWVQLDQLY